MSVIFRQTNCLLEYSEDNGTTWAIAADFGQCLKVTIGGEPGLQKRCNIAVYLTSFLKRSQDVVIAGAQQNATNEAIARSLLGLLAVIPTFAVGAAIVAAGILLRAAIDGYGVTS